MSPTRIRLSRRAPRDLAAIASHTAQTWGTGQRSRYRDLLAQAFRRIADHPEIGVSGTTCAQDTAA